jgi:hypothetical protein
MTPAPRISVDTLRAVDAPRSSAETLCALDSPLSSSSAEADTLREKEEMHGPILGAAILPPMPVARGTGTGNETEGEGNGERQGLEMGILCVSFLCFIFSFFLLRAFFFLGSLWGEEGGRCRGCIRV